MQMAGLGHGHGHQHENITIDWDRWAGDRDIGEVAGLALVILLVMVMSQGIGPLSTTLVICNDDTASRSLHGITF